MHRVLGDLEAEIVGGPINGRGLRASAGHQYGESVDVVVAAVVDRAETAQVDDRRAAEFAGDQHQRLIEESTLLEIGHQRRDGLIYRAGRVLVTHDIGVVIPAGVDDLHESHALLHQAPRGQAGAADPLVSVAGEDGGAFFAGVEHIRRLGLHAEGDFHGLHSRFQLRCSIQPIDVGLVQVTNQVQLLEMDLVHLLEQIELRPLGRWR